MSSPRGVNRAENRHPERTPAKPHIDIDIPSSRHPFEIFMLFAVLLASIRIYFSSYLPESVEAAMPVWAQVTWALLFGLGTVTALVGIAWKNKVTGLLLEQIGLVAVGFGALIFASTIALFTGHLAMTSATQTAFGLACLWRWWDIQRIIRKAQHTTNGGRVT